MCCSVLLHLHLSQLLPFACWLVCSSVSLSAMLHLHLSQLLPFACWFVCSSVSLSANITHFLLCYDRLSVLIGRRQNDGFLQTYFSLEYSEI